MRFLAIPDVCSHCNAQEHEGPCFDEPLIIAAVRYAYEQPAPGTPKLYVQNDQADALRAVSGYKVIALDTTTPS
jgi:hypothetical protein